jgi:diguanylate cyclase (GGDEF)-like protein
VSDTEQTLFSHILRTLHIATLVRKGPKEYEVYGEPPDFYNNLFPPEDGVTCSRPWEISSMLDMFIGDAELFFSRDVTDETFSSGVWQEDGLVEGDSALIAEAFTVEGGTQVVTVRLLQQDYRDRVGVLNDVRSKLLENRELGRTIDYYRDKSRLDGLTGIFNRATMVELLHGFIIESNTKNKSLSLIMLDIDNFKKFNDTYGHLAGDEALRAIGSHLKDSCRSDDVVARYGGEEFCVIMRASTQENTLKTAHLLCDGIRKLKIAALPSVTVSVGCAIYRKNESVEQFMKRADLALYDIKYSTKNGVSMR